MFEKLTELKNELSDGQILRKGEVNNRRVSRKISSICQKAIAEIILEAEVSRAYRMAGVEDGKKTSGLLSERDKSFIINVLGGEGPYKKWSKFEMVSVLNDHFGKDKKHNSLTPRFMDLMDGKIIIDEWIEQDLDKAEDRRGEMCWSYIEGCFEGIVEAIKK